MLGSDLQGPHLGQARSGGTAGDPQGGRGEKFHTTAGEGQSQEIPENQPPRDYTAHAQQE